MFGLSALGIVHTVLSLIAMACGIWSLVRRKEILLENLPGKIYLITTALTALSAFGLFNFNGKFGVGHGLTVLTLLAIAAGTMVAVTGIFGRWTRLLQALFYSTTLLFHVVPGITETLTRLPLGHPLVNREEPAILGPIYGVLFLLYFTLLFIQLRWLWKASVKPTARVAPVGVTSQSG